MNQASTRNFIPAMPLIAARPVILCIYKTNNSIPSAQLIQAQGGVGKTEFEGLCRELANLLNLTKQSIKRHSKYGF
jgi:hypothetical protein